MSSTAAVATFSGNRRRARRAGAAQRISNGGLAGGELGVGVPDRRHQLWIAEDGECLLERLQVLEAEHDRGRTAVLGDHDAAVLALEALHHL